MNCGIAKVTKLKSHEMERFRKSRGLNASTYRSKRLEVYLI